MSIEKEPELQNHLVQEVGDELVVLGPDSRAHCLGADATRVFKFIREQPSWDEAKEQLDKDVLERCLPELEAVGLLEAPDGIPRRNLLKAAAAAPLLLTVALPEPAAAASGCPTCMINSPTTFASVGGVETIDFDATSATGNMLRAGFEYSTGGPFFPASDEGTGGLAGNPTLPFAAAAGLTWDWSSSSDIPTMAFPVTFRVTVTDVGNLQSSTCVVTSLNVSNNPTCNITSPMMGASVAGTVSISFTVASPSGNPLDVDFQFSTGGPFMNATDGGGGSLSGNPATGVAAGAHTWGWNSVTDVGTATGVSFRITVTDSVTGASSQCVVNNLATN